MKRKFGKKKSIIVLFLIFTSLVLLIELGMYLSCFYYSSKVSQKDQELCRIMLFGSSENPEGNTVSAKISILDRHGTEIAIIERSWPDPYLSLDFRGAFFLNRMYYFPQIVYGVSTVTNSQVLFRGKKGTRLDRYYVENFSCLLGINEFERKALFYIQTFALNKNTVNLSGCENGIYYGIYNKNGKLVLLKE